MKRLLTVLLTVSVLLGTLCTSVMAHELPLGGSATPAAPELTTTKIYSDFDTNIAKGLTSAPHMSANMLNAGTAWNDEVNAISELKLADLGNHFKYGFSMLGVKNLERSIGAGIDGIWSNGNTGELNTLQFNTNRAKGAISWISSGVLYNEKGEPTPEGKGAADGYIYQNLFTFNFGKVAILEGIGYAYPNNTGIGYPQAADIYVSDDGVNWTLVGYYDRPTKRMNGGDYDSIAADTIPADELGKMKDNQLYTQFVLPAGTKGQFLRIAATSATGKTNPTNREDYNTFSNAIGEKCAFRELFVFGTVTDEVKTPWMDPADDPYLQATQTTELLTTEEDLPAPKPPVTKAPTTTAKPEVSKAPEASATVSTGANEEKEGCGATVGLGIGVILAGAAFAAILLKRKED